MSQIDMQEYEIPVVRGEPVEIVSECAPGEQQQGILGYTRHDATVLVRYGDGEQGYVTPAHISEGG